MNKIKLLARQLDGTTLVEQAPDFQLVEGWTQATLTSPAGVLPAGLWGKVPGGDPYLLHINVLTTLPLSGGDIFELQSGPPIQPRARFLPTPNNTQLVLVRPSDRLRLLIHVHDICKPEAWVGVDSDDPHNHALMARRLLEQLCDDAVLLNITQYHDDGYILYQYYRRSEAMRPRLARLLEAVQDVELFVLFFLIDSCTAGKHREPVEWFLYAVAQEHPLSERIQLARKRLD